MKGSQAIVSTYCDFCNQQTEPDSDVLRIRQRREREISPGYSCSLCGRDLCDRHTYLVTFPRGMNTKYKELDHQLRFYRMDFADGTICPECAAQPLTKIGIILLGSAQKNSES